MVIDFTGSKHNAQMLVERYLDTGEQPDFMEYICFRSYYVEAKFHGYGVDYVLDNFCVYAGIAKVREVVIRETTTKSETIKKIEHCYCPTMGTDLINAARKKGLDFIIHDGRLQLIKQESNIVDLDMENFNYNSENQQYKRVS